MTKVKSFQENTIYKLEKAIAAFINSQPNVKVITLSMNSLLHPCFSNPLEYSAILIYE